MTTHLVTDQRLAPLVEADDFDDLLRDIVKELAADHARLDRPAASPITSSSDSWRTRFRAIEAAIERLDPPTAAAGEGSAQRAADLLREVGWLAEQYTQHRDALFKARFHEGAIVEQAPEPGEAAWARDVLVEVAALACDVELLFGPRAGQRVFSWYHEFSNEHHPSSLAHFFLSYHALQHCLDADEIGRLDGGDVAELLAVARAHLEQAKPRLVLVGGGPGTGKSTLAAAIAEVVGWPVLTSQETRAELSGAAGDASDSHRRDRTDAVYAQLLERAETLLHQGEPVILDASWSYERHREQARASARAASSSVVEIECVLDPAIARERLAWEQSAPWDSGSDTPELVDVMAAQRSTWSEATAIDTSLPLLRTRSDALKAILGFPPLADPVDEPESSSA